MLPIPHGACGAAGDFLIGIAPGGSAIYMEHRRKGGRAMRAVILAGGFGTRIAEESHLRPKPMVEIGGMPILWHIMKIFGAQGVTDFVICCGYKGDQIKEYFSHYALHRGDVTFDFRAGGRMEVHTRQTEPWRVTLADTGLTTMTGGRLKRAAPYLQGERFFLTYGDGVADVDLAGLLRCHLTKGKLATMTVVRPEGRFGTAELRDGLVTAFREKAAADGGWINGGFFVMEPAVLSLIEGDDTVLERQPLERLAAEGELAACPHTGFWQCMDTLRDRQQLEKLWKEGAPWKIWQD